MLAELFSIGFIGSAVYGTYKLCQKGIAALSQPGSSRSKRPRQAYSPEVRRASQEMQVALIEVRQAPDFRRAANYALQARAVPQAFRQRQYYRFRPLLVEHFASLVENGASAEALMPGLTQLVTALGLAQFEADYIRIEAEARLAREVAPSSDFAQQLREAQAAYRSRTRALEAMKGLDDDSRDQLLEQEKIRFQERLRAISGEQPEHEP